MKKQTHSAHFNHATAFSSRVLMTPNVCVPSTKQADMYLQFDIIWQTNCADQLVFSDRGLYWRRVNKTLCNRKQALVKSNTSKKKKKLTNKNA